MPFKKTENVVHITLDLVTQHLEMDSRISVQRSVGAPVVWSKPFAVQREARGWENREGVSS